MPPSSALTAGTLAVRAATPTSVDPASLDFPGLEQRQRLPAGLLNAVMRRESNGDPSAVSPKGAQGLFQFLPNTAHELGIDPTDPKEAARGASVYLRQLLDKYQGSLPHALAAYNWGMGNLDKYGMANLPSETRAYLQAVAGQLNPMTPGQSAAPPDATQPPPAPLVSFGSEVPTQSVATGTLPADASGAIGAAMSARKAGVGAGGAGGVSGSPDADAFMQFMGEMLGNPTKGLTQLMAGGGGGGSGGAGMMPRAGMARGGRVPKPSPAAILKRKL